MPDCRISTGNCEIAIKTSHLPAEISQSATYIQEEEEKDFLFTSPCQSLNWILNKLLQNVLLLKDLMELLGSFQED